MVNVRVAGSLISDVGKLSAFDFSTSYGSGFGGHDQASWTFSPRGTFSADNYSPRASVDIYHGGAHSFEGEFSELSFADNGDVKMSARGHGYRLLDLDSILWDPVPLSPDIYYPTGNIVAGWDFAEAELGLDVNVVGALPVGAPSMGNVSEQPVKLAEVITAHAQYEGNKWTVWGKDLEFVTDDTSAPVEFAAPQSLIAVADTDYYTHVYVWYVWDGPDGWDVATTYSTGDTVTHDGRKWVAAPGSTGEIPAEGAYWTERPYTTTPNQWSFGRAIDTDGLALFDARTVVVDYRGLGKISNSEADAIALGLLEQVKGRFIFTGSITLTPASGFPVPLHTLRAGTALRLKRLRTSMGTLMPYGANVFIIGRTEYSWTPDSETCTLTPMGAVARNLPDILRGVPRDGGSAIAGAA
jgi:hypothetical protein